MGSPVIGKDFHGRKEDLKFLQRELIDKSSLGLVLTGMKHIGKTSLLKEFLRILEKDKDVVAVYVDISSLHPLSTETFCDSILIASFEAFQKKGLISEEANISQALSGSFEAYATILRKPGISNSIKDYIELKFKDSNQDNQDKELLKKSLEVVDELAKEAKVRGLLLLDESQFLDEIDSGLVWNLKPLVQKWTSSGLVLVGLGLEGLFDSPRAPFHLIFKNGTVEAFDSATVAGMLDEKLKKVGYLVDKKASEEIFKNTGGIPFYVQLLGDKITDSGQKKVTKGVVEEAFSTLLQESDIMFMPELDKASSTEKSVLIEIALGSNISNTAKNLSKTTATVAKLVERLVAKMYLRKIKAGQYEFNDLVFRNWLVYKYSKNSSKEVAI